MAVTGSAAIALRMLAVTSSGGPLEGGSAAVSLRMLAAAGAGAALDGYGDGAATLAMLDVAGRCSEPIFGAAAVELERLGAIGAGRDVGTGLPVAIALTTGRMRASGGGIFEFDGPANRGVSWSIVEGGGLITAFSDYTDEYGRAYARYDAGGYDGPLRLQVEYGA